MNGDVRVHFVGAGPGDPMLMTLRGRDLIEQADVLIYADSLVSEDVLRWASPDAERHGSAGMTLAEITTTMIAAARAGRRVVRLHTGDAAVYGAIDEQMAALEDAGIAYAVVPGVSSVFAAAAALCVELTVPEVSQTLILTRRAGRTPAPEQERLPALAGHGATMAVFLSVNQVEAVCEDLLLGGYGLDTPAAVVYRASWPDEQVVRGTLGNLSALVEQAGISSQALILVGWALDPTRTRGRSGRQMPRRSRLYDPQFTHGFRGARSGTGGATGRLQGKNAGTSPSRERVP